MLYNLNLFHQDCHQKHYLRQVNKKPFAYGTSTFGLLCKSNTYQIYVYFIYTYIINILTLLIDGFITEMLHLCNSYKIYQDCDLVDSCINVPSLALNPDLRNLPINDVGRSIN